MAGLRAFAASKSCHPELFPLSHWGEPLKVQERTAVECGARGSDNPAQVQQSFFIDLVPAEQISVVAEVAQEPVELPQGLGRAIESSGDRLSGVLFGLEGGQAQGEEWLLRVPAIEGSLDSDQEKALQDVIPVLGFTMKTWDVTLHDSTSFGCA